MKRDIQAALNAPYFLHKDPAIGEEIIRFARSDNRGNVGVNSVLLLIPLAHPDKAEEWHRKYRHYVQRAANIIDNAGSDHVGWNDYWMMRWMILGESNCLAKLYRQTQQTNIWAPPGHSPRAGSKSVGEYAVWMTDSVSQQCPEFARVWFDYVKTVDNDMYDASPFPWLMGHSDALSANDPTCEPVRESQRSAKT